jgi:hypothetical protein
MTSNMVNHTIEARSGNVQYDIPHMVSCRSLKSVPSSLYGVYIQKGGATGHFGVVANVNRNRYKRRRTLDKRATRASGICKWGREAALRGTELRQWRVVREHIGL